MGSRWLKDPPLCLRLIREVHARTLQGVREAVRSPRRVPAFAELDRPSGLHACERAVRSAALPRNALSSLEKFRHDRESLPPLIQCGLAHAQFETIHPFRITGGGPKDKTAI